jgi:predicted membrane chloride channel (bestrophin family)
MYRFATAGVTVAIMSLSIIGLQEVGRKLGDPFGDDMVDLSVMSFVTSTLAGTRRQITCPVPE